MEEQIMGNGWGGEKAEVEMEEDIRR